MPEGYATHSSTKNGFNARTTGSLCDRYDSYLHRSASTSRAIAQCRIPEILDVAGRYLSIHDFTKQTASTHLSFVAAHSCNFFWIAGPSPSRKFCTALFVFACSSSSWSPSSAVRYLLQVSSNDGTGSLGSLSCDENVRFTGGFASNFVMVAIAQWEGRGNGENAEWVRESHVISQRSAQNGLAVVGHRSRQSPTFNVSDGD